MKNNNWLSLFIKEDIYLINTEKDENASEPEPKIGKDITLCVFCDEPTTIEEDLLQKILESTNISKEHIQITKKPLDANELEKAKACKLIIAFGPDLEKITEPGIYQVAGTNIISTYSLKIIRENKTAKAKLWKDIKEILKL